MANSSEQANQEQQDWTSEEPAAESPPPKVEKFHGPAYIKDPGFFRAVINFAGWTLLLAVGIMGLLAANERTIPEGIVAVASGLVGLLTGIFAAKATGGSE